MVICKLLASPSAQRTTFLGVLPPNFTFRPPPLQFPPFLDLTPLNQYKFSLQLMLCFAAFTNVVSRGNFRHHYLAGAYLCLQPSSQSDCSHLTATSLLYPRRRNGPLHGADRKEHCSWLGYQYEWKRRTVPHMKRGNTREQLQTARQSTGLIVKATYCSINICKPRENNRLHLYY